MPTKENKVRFNLKNVHYAIATEDDAGGYTYSTPIPWPGAKTLTQDPEGEQNEFYADGIKYYVSYGNNGYSGSLEMARIIDQFRVDVLGEKYDTNGVLVERADVHTVVFALLFEFDGDQKSRRHVLYNVQAGRPGVSGQTTEGSREPNTESIDISSSPMRNGLVKAQTTPQTTDETYDNWYKQVYVPQEATE